MWKPQEVRCILFEVDSLALAVYGKLIGSLFQASIAPLCPGPPRQIVIGRSSFLLY